MFSSRIDTRPGHPVLTVQVIITIYTTKGYVVWWCHPFLHLNMPSLRRDDNDWNVRFKKKDSRNINPIFVGTKDSQSVSGRKGLSRVMSKWIWFGLILWHINHFKLLKAKSILYIFEKNQFSISTQFSSIWPIETTLSGATTPDQSGPGSNGNEGVVHIPHSSSITRTSLSDCWLSY